MQRIVSLIAFLTVLFLLTASAEEDRDSLMRTKVTDYAQSVHDYVWTLDDGFLLLYNKNYRPRMNGKRLVFDGWQPYVVSGTVRGVPYSLAIFSNGLETPFSIYRHLTAAEKTEIAWIYQYYSNGSRISAKYGMSCATFLSECLRQGFPDDPPPLVYGAKTLISDPSWKVHFTFGRNGIKNYPQLRKADFLYKNGHVMLVMDNDPEDGRMLVMDQTPPDYAVAHCENITEVQIELPYKDRLVPFTARKLCMECEACRQATTGTQLRWIDYDELRQKKYQAVFVNYGTEKEKNTAGKKA